VDFRNCIIVMTSNIGAEELRKQGSLGFALNRDEKEEAKSNYDDMRKKLLESLRKVFRPEFINRLDGVIVFHPLAQDHLRKIVNLELEKVAERMRDHNISLRATEPALDQIAQEGFDPEMGARPLRRVIQDKVEDHLSDAVLAHEFNDGDSILIDVDKEKHLVFKREKRKRNVEKKAEPEETAQVVA
jgi:ATP-dependent Clp protease ATP-binding subunit ClpC